MFNKKEKPKEQEKTEEYIKKIPIDPKPKPLELTETLYVSEVCENSYYSHPCSHLQAKYELKDFAREGKTVKVGIYKLQSTVCIKQTTTVSTDIVNCNQAEPK